MNTASMPNPVRSSQRAGINGPPEAPSSPNARICIRQEEKTETEKNRKPRLPKRGALASCCVWHMSAARMPCLLAGFSEHEGPRCLDCDFIGQGTQLPVGLLQLFPDGD